MLINSLYNPNVSKIKYSSNSTSVEKNSISFNNDKSEALKAYLEGQAAINSAVVFKAKAVGSELS